MKNIFKTKNNKIVIAQFPNTPLFLAMGFYLLQFLQIAHITKIAEAGLFLSLIYWAYLEIRFGVNTFRKILGVLVLLYILVTKFST